MRGAAMSKVTGIGGLFFRAQDQQALAQWYETHLGLTQLFKQEAGLTVFAPFRAETDYFPADKQWMFNLRVDDLDGMLDHLRALGVAVETRPDEWDSLETGRFARIHDPEGNQVELWEPAK
jgi:predicted enzyme related to lactoylglutathione lyase